ncbi:MAG TPA: galactose-1-phosphate uridylyltransferase [bacterium]|nr:galactose-1-phosphate uridylyltransferase [bacterium]
MSEIRKDPVVNKWVITLDDKEFSPKKDAKLEPSPKTHDPECPFCTGNEAGCGREIASVRTGDKWQVRVVPNNRPYLRVETPLKRRGEGMFDTVSDTGANEVIIETPVHNADLDTIDLSGVTSIVEMYRDRINDLARDTRLEYMLIFKNRGSGAGGKISHLNSQLMAMPVVPQSVQDEIDCSKKYFDLKKRCVYCDIVENERMFKERVVADTGKYLLIAPFASRAPFEMWILPAFHSSHFNHINGEEAASLARILKDAVARLNKAVGMPAYNYMIHTAPVKSGSLVHYHWHIEILPRLRPIAGFEWGSGFCINPTFPEEAAAYLRDVL